MSDKKSMKTRYQEWKTRNDLDDASVVILACMGLSIIGFSAYTVKVVKDAYDELEDQEQWTKEEFAEGNHVFQLVDGSLVSVQGPVKIY